VEQVLLKKQNEMLSCLSKLPGKILSIQGLDNVTEFVLHDLCHDQCFGLRRAAYFVDNPDFDWVKGIAGFSRDEAFGGGESLWKDPHAFSMHMQAAQFNQQVRMLNRTSSKLKKTSDEATTAELARELGLKDYGYCSWNMKHDNHGLVVYEKFNADDTYADDHLYNGLMLLSFCPVF
jgi:hypothetical protein